MQAILKNKKPPGLLRTALTLVMNCGLAPLHGFGHIARSFVWPEHYAPPVHQINARLSELPAALRLIMSGAIRVNRHLSCAVLALPRPPAICSSFRAAKRHHCGVDLHHA